MHVSTQSEVLLRCYQKGNSGCGDIAYIHAYLSILHSFRPTMYISFRLSCVCVLCVALHVRNDQPNSGQWENFQMKGTSFVQKDTEYGDFLQQALNGM